MKKLAIVVAALMAVALVVGCGSSGNVCEDAANIMAQGMDEGCQQQTDCCYCTCWLDGHKSVDTSAQDCQCVSDSGSGGGTGGGTGGECTGEAKTVAEACVADEANCKQQGSDLVTTMCQGF